MRPLLLTMLVLSIVLWCSYWTVNVFGHHHSNTFDERAWRRAGTYLTEHMDPAKRPCEHFFEHVCGKYGRDNELDDDIGTATMDQGQIIKDTVRGVIEKISDVPATSSSSAEIERLLLRFYHQCLDRNQATTGQNIVEKMVQASEAALSDLFVSTPTSDDYEGGENQTGDALSAGAVGGNETEDNRWRIIGRMWRVFGASTLAIDWDHAGFQLELNNVQNGTELIIKPIAVSIGAHLVEEMTTSRYLSLAELLLLVPNVRWRAYFDEALGPGTSQAWLTHPERATFQVFGAGLLNEMGALISRMDDTRFYATIKTGLANAFMVTVTGDLANSTQEMCLKTVIDRQPSAVAFLYLRSIGSSPTEWRHEILSMRQNIFSAFRFLLNSVDWMDERDKEKVRSKLDEIKFFPGIPDWADDEEKVIQSMQQYSYEDHPDSSTPFQTEIEWMKSDQSRLIQTYRTGQEKDAMSSFVVNAFYTPNNKITMMLGWMLPPIYDIKYPMAVKYGSIGYIMGHELIHAFDAHELKRPSIARQNDWLSEQAWKEFEKRKACVIKEYSKFCIEDKSYCVSGEMNIGENMADVDGLKVAYTAFKFAKQVLGADPPVPAMLNYTEDQLFFVANARFWCAPGWDDAWMVDEHSPQRARVDVTLANNPIFARAFKCQVGSKYAPLNECTVWGSLAEPAARKRRHRQRRSDHPDHL